MKKINAKHAKFFSALFAGSLLSSQSYTMHVSDRLCELCAFYSIQDKNLSDLCGKKSYIFAQHLALIPKIGRDNAKVKFLLTP